MLVALPVIIACQTYQWLRSGYWPDWSVLKVITPLLSMESKIWLSHPQSWYGAHRAIDFMIGLQVWEWIVVCFLVCALPFMRR